MADLGFWRSVRPLAFGLAAGLATIALTGSGATAADGGAERASASRQGQGQGQGQSVRVMPPVGQQAPCACESQVGAYLAGKPAAIAAGGGPTTVTLTAWGQGSGKVGGTVVAHRLPEGWRVTPSSRSYSVDSSGSAASARLSFGVAAPAETKPGTYDVVFRTTPFSGTDSRELRVALTVR